jgi:DNA-binding CsgD family transcriptional regulator
VVRGVRRGGRLAVVEGEAGIGKTRLVEAALATAPANVLAAGAEELDAYRPFAQIADVAAEAGPAWRERVDAHLMAWEIGPGAAAERQFRIGETILELLDELCARGPVVLAFEDLHWADPTTLGVLARVAANLDAVPAAMIVTARPHPRRPELERLLGRLETHGATRLHVGPLDDGACVDLLAALVGGPPGERLIAQARRAAGNPLFVGELVAALRASGALEGADVAVAEPAPSLPVTILHRLSFLPPDAVELLELASVLGTGFAAGDLARLADRPVSELLPPLRAAQRAGVLAEQGDRLAFRHELIRDALYDDMPVTVRRGLHRQVASASTGERMVEHLRRAAEPGDEQDAAALAAAARELVGRHPGGAVELLRQAIELSADPAARRRELLPELGEAMVAAGLLAEGEEACREALGQELDAARAARIRLGLIASLMRRARVAEAVEQAEAGLATPGIAEADRLAGWLAMAHSFAGDAENAVAEARKVLAGSDPQARALATNALAIAADAGGRFAEEAELIADGVRWAEETGTRESHDTRPHMIQGLVLMRLDRFDDAAQAIERGRRAAEAFGIADAIPVYHYQAAFLAFLQGRLDDAPAELDAHARLAAETGIGWLVSYESLYALIALHRDELIAAERHVAAAEREAAAGAPPFGTDLMVLARALVLEAAGDPEPALDALAATFAAAPSFQPLLGPELARLAPARADGVPAALREIADRSPGARSLEAAALRAHGLVDSDDEALRAAVELLRGTGRTLELARAAEDVGSAELLAEARAAYERSGAVRDVARVDAAQRALGVRRGVGGPRRRPSSGWEALTDTELKVVRLVAERLTNPEIAERMFISRRTVQSHVSHALAKLGVADRRALAEEAARHAGWRLRVEGIAEQPQEPKPAVEPAVRPAVDGDDA